MRIKIDLSSIFCFSSQIPKPPGTPNTSLEPIAPAARANYLRQFHALVDVTKTNGFMPGSQAKNVLVQTGLPHHVLHQIWYETLIQHSFHRYFFP